MPVSLDSIALRDGYVEVVLGGEYEGRLVHFQEYLKRILDAADQHGCTRVLLDNSRVRYFPDILAEHLVAERMAQLVPPTFRFAFIAPGNIPAQNSHFETVAVNRGARVRVFRSRDEALGWLLGAAAEAA